MLQLAAIPSVIAATIFINQTYILHHSKNGYSNETTTIAAIQFSGKKIRHSLNRLLKMTTIILALRFLLPLLASTNLKASSTAVALVSRSGFLE
ncbi:MAG: hypothetical protein FIO03_04645 [Nitrosopumilales archaeon]|nr:hypothetical protein [Nitrosopumilales archaeon]